jgi:hypothetical protein
MGNPSQEQHPEIVVKAAHFITRDSAALFGALVAVERSVDLTIIEDPDNPLIREHAVYRANCLSRIAEDLSSQYPDTLLAEKCREMFSEDKRISFIENEVANLKSIIETHGMGVFAVRGSRENVDAFMSAHKDQPSAV